MKLGYTIVYVPDVAQSLKFFEQAFGLPTRFLHESGTYGELETGETTLAFSLFRFAVILEGIAARAKSGSAAAADAVQVGAQAAGFARRAVALID